MWLDRVSNPGPLALESNELPAALHGLADQSFLFENDIIITIHTCGLSSDKLSETGLFADRI